MRSVYCYIGLLFHFPILTRPFLHFIQSSTCFCVVLAALDISCFLGFAVQFCLCLVVCLCHCLLLQSYGSNRVGERSGIPFIFYFLLPTFNSTTLVCTRWFVPALSLWVLVFVPWCFRCCCSTVAQIGLVNARNEWFHCALYLYIHCAWPCVLFGCS